MKLKHFALIGLLSGLILSSCGDDDQVVKKPVTPAKPSSGTTTDPTNTTGGGGGNPTAEVNLSDYKPQEEFKLSDVTVSSTTYNVGKTFQKVEGLGGMFYIPRWNPPTLTGQQVDVLYKDFGLNIVRLFIEPDKNLWKSDLDLIKRAVANGAIVIACPWFAPDAMNDTQTKLVWDDGIKGMKEKPVPHRKTSSYADYADFLIEYVQFMKKQGVTIYAISLQNEPDAEFTYWSPEEMRDFTKGYGKYIAEEADVKIMSPEACGMDSQYTDPILNTKEAFEATDIIAGHLYQGFSNINNVHATNGYVKNRYNYINSLWGKISPSGKSWWMTEHLFNDGEKSDNPSDWVFLNWDYCLNHLALEIHDCMAASCSAYIYWYIKRFYGLIYDTDKRSGSNKENTYTHNAYIMAQWAKYATGKTRIDASCSDKDIKMTAYKSDDGKYLSFVAVNYSDKIKYLSIDAGTTNYIAYGHTCDEESQTLQALTPVKPNCFENKVVLAIPAKGIGSVTIAK
ncbi:MAG: hypothetical protein MJZ61_05125 [Bacteroidales bacterium]|nr:hypothetical protein [Bacteroidales bacterium]